MNILAGIFIFCITFAAIHKIFIMEGNKGKRFLTALAFISVMFFVLGFAMGVNSFLIPALKGTMELPSRIAHLLLAATFVPFLLFGYPAAKTIERIGYRRTMALSLLFFAAAFGLYALSARVSNFGLFLLASFVSGGANAFLQASVNPYVTILGNMESAAKRISIMGICNKVGWSVAPWFFALMVADERHVATDELYLPFFILIGALLLIYILFSMVPLPPVAATGENAAQGGECPYAANKRSVWEFPHLLMGAVALFVYVGVETLALGTAVDYAGTLGLRNASLYAWLPTGGMVAGYLCGIAFIPRVISQAQALRICSWVGIAGSLGVILLPGVWSVCSIFLMALGCSLMWPALWPLAIADLGRFTKAGSGLLTMSIAGGAVMPALFGFLQDGSLDAQGAYCLALPSFLIILYYGTRGYKVRTCH